jgi:hypothetical protein
MKYAEELKIKFPSNPAGDDIKNYISEKLNR